MPDKRSLQTVLDQGQALLAKGDVNGYWSLMSKHSNYAKLAGQVAKGKGLFAEIANERLQRKSQEGLGRSLSEQEMGDIRLRIAKADRLSRVQSLIKEGHIGVTGKQTTEYHKAVFVDKGLPSDTYTADNFQKVMGPYWSSNPIVDAPTHDGKDFGFGDALDHAQAAFEKDPKGFIKSTWEMAKDTGYAAIDAIDKDDASQGTKPKRNKNGAVTLPMPDRVPTSKPAEQKAPATLQQKKADPAAQKLLQDFLKPGDAAAEAMLNPVGKWTERESEAVMKKRMSLSPSDPDYERYVKAEKSYFDTRYGKGAAKMDETGKLIPPQPKGPVPTTTAAVKTPDGQPLDKALTTVAKHVVAQAQNHSTPKAVKGLQTGLNLMADATQSAPLKTDGIAGPTTVQATRMATAKLGAPKVKEAAALGTLAEAARDPALTSNPDALKATIDSTVGPLFGKDAPAQSNAWGRGVQAAVNDTGADVLGSTFQPITEDGWIGPKTAQAFGQIASAAAPMDFAKRLGMGLGFV